MENEKIMKMTYPELREKVCELVKQFGIDNECHFMDIKVHFDNNIIIGKEFVSFKVKIY